MLCFVVDGFLLNPLQFHLRRPADKNPKKYRRNLVSSSCSACR
jgi:hypothetical protein